VKFRYCGLGAIALIGYVMIKNYPILTSCLIVFLFLIPIFNRIYWIHRQTPYLSQPKEKLYVDQNGYFRTSTTDRLLHRDIAYKYHYLPNRQNYPKGFGAYVVHHRDENKWHNDPSNLVLLEPAQHTWLHNK
jgi:hypothetical protein